jgi:hypothetical protein
MVGNGCAEAGPLQSPRSGQYESSGLLWRPEWRGGIVYHIFVCICIFLGKWIREAGGGGMTPT